ncbi:MAG: hypothetical protein CMH32_00455 [Micavibrio sp.]|nr:hypothetical protein [Micavibrio sp.]HCK32957.1 hypothetical protein [Rhodospirillaceae bacterium]|tara:strand:+ start:220 stop:558 length:339 start_codon:yes stop_codon:yes gene_type:complete
MKMGTGKTATRLVGGLFLVAASGACASVPANTGVQTASADENASVTPNESSSFIIELDTEEAKEFAYCYNNLSVISNDPELNRDYCSIAYQLHRAYAKFSAPGYFGPDYVMK